MAKNETNVGSASLPAAASWYRQNGFDIVPLGRLHHPATEGWKTAVMSDEMIRDWADDCNIGLRVGKDHADVDLDSEEACEVALHFLTGQLYPKMSYGRAGQLRHAIYHCPGAQLWQVTDGQHMMVELRGLDASGAPNCSMLPPSFHPKHQQRLEFINKGLPGTVDPGELRHAVRLIGIAALIARHWPGEGMRQTYAVCVAGALVKSPLSSSDVDTIWNAVITTVAKHDREWRKRQTCLKDSRKQLANGKGLKGLYALQKEIGLDKKVVHKLAELLDIQIGADPYSAIAPDMYERYKCVVLEGKPCVISNTFNPSIGALVRQGQTYADFRATLMNRTVEVVKNGKQKLVPLADAFLMDPDRMQYDGVVMAPPENVWEPGADRMTEDGQFVWLNLWMGYRFSPVEGDWSLFKQHMLDNICCGDVALFGYLMRWIAWVLQHPTKLPGTALVLRGSEGNGKNTFAECLGAIFGSHFLSTASGALVAGRFNAHLENVCLMLSNEATWAGSHEQAAMLKALVTDGLTAYEGKGQNARVGTNHVSLIMSTNSDWVVPASLEARRWAVFDVSDAHMDDAAYFIAIKEQMIAGGCAAMLHELLAMDLSDFNIRRVPNTKGLVNQKLQSLNAAGRWLFDCLYNGVISGYASTNKDRLDFPWDAGKECFTSVLNDAHVAWCRSMNIRPMGSGHQLALHLHKLLKTEDGRKLLKSGPKKWDGANSRSVYLLPGLRDARAAFARAVGGDIDWGDDEGGEERAAGDGGPTGDGGDGGPTLADLLEEFK